MFYEEKYIKDILHCRTSPNDKFEVKVFHDANDAASVRDTCNVRFPEHNHAVRYMPDSPGKFRLVRYKKGPIEAFVSESFQGNFANNLDKLLSADSDPVNRPQHYTSHPSGVECIQVTEHMNFNCGNAIKYIWRADEKGDALEDLKKARWYIDREIKRRGGE